MQGACRHTRATETVDREGRGLGAHARSQTNVTRHVDGVGGGVLDLSGVSDQTQTDYRRASPSPSPTYIAKDDRVHIGGVDLGRRQSSIGGVHGQIGRGKVLQLATEGPAGSALGCDDVDSRAGDVGGHDL